MSTGRAHAPRAFGWHTADRIELVRGIAPRAIRMEPSKIPHRPPDDPLSLSEARYRTLVQTISQIVWTASALGELQGEQPAWGAYTGQTPEEYRGWGWLDAVHAEDRLRVRQLWRRAAQTGESWHAEHRLRTPRGDYRWVVLRAAPVHDSAGRLIEWVGAHTDVHETKLAAEERARLFEAERTARIAAERAMRRLRDAQEISDAATAEQGLDEMLHTLVERLRIALHADTATVLLLTDDAMELVVAASLGRDRELEEGTRIPLGQGFAGRVAAEARPALRQGMDSRVSSEILREHYGSMIGAPLLAAGRLVGVVRIGTAEAREFGEEDVRLLQLVADRVANAVERARLLDRERQARAEAEGANRAKMDFLAMMSHELRTPLNAIAGYTELLAMGLRGPLNDAQLADVQAIHRNELYLLTLVEQVLSFAKLEAGHVELDITDVRLSATLESVLALVAPQLTQRKLALSMEACDPALRVLADGERLQQILLNLLSNAVKFTPEGGRIMIRCEAERDRARVLVKDTGIGIPADALDRIFLPFVQLEQKLTRKFSGSGLGLAISRELARAMNGDLTATSELQRGSEFVLELPLCAY